MHLVETLATNVLLMRVMLFLAEHHWHSQSVLSVSLKMTLFLWVAVKIIECLLSSALFVHGHGHGHGWFILPSRAGGKETERESERACNVEILYLWVCRCVVRMECEMLKKSVFNNFKIAAHDVRGDNNETCLYDDASHVIAVTSHIVGCWAQT